MESRSTLTKRVLAFLQIDAKSARDCFRAGARVAKIPAVGNAWCALPADGFFAPFPEPPLVARPPPPVAERPNDEVIAEETTGAASGESQAARPRTREELHAEACKELAKANFPMRLNAVTVDTLGSINASSAYHNEK